MNAGRFSTAIALIVLSFSTLPVAQEKSEPAHAKSTIAPAGRTRDKITPPKVVYTTDPTYTAAARAAKFQGVVVVRLTVDSNGDLRDPKVIRGAGYGLDEKAIEAVQKWKFKPAMRDGVPISATLNVEVLFRL